jgi:hypothetical protein
MARDNLLYSKTSEGSMQDMIKAYVKGKRNLLDKDTVRTMVLKCSFKKLGVTM